ncbi:AAA family ATPase [Streptomyces sp. NPDC001843]|uniref:AAA family ATPase n=1 Tax=Streptomyces sp. NPDC001843 TaxID=3364617 RepID=UPI00367B7BA2
MNTIVTVRALADDVVIHGHCYTNVPDSRAGDLLRVATSDAAIYCRAAWDFTDRFGTAAEIALDRWQRAALRGGEGAEVRVEVERGTVPPAGEVRLNLLRGTTASGAELRDFLAAGLYPLYPGLRFSHRPLGAAGDGGDRCGEYVVDRVLAEGIDVPVAAVDPSLRISVQRSPALRAVWPGYEDLGGIDDVVALLRREIEVPLRRSEALRRLGVYAPAGILLHGPPGTGKTTLTRAVSARCAQDGVETVMLRGPALVTQQREEAEAALREALRPVAEGEPARLVVIEDIDYLAPARDTPVPGGSFLGLLHELLDRPDRPVIIATTSRPDDVDAAIRRLGRLGQGIRMPLPSEEGRRAILAIHTRDLSLAIDDEMARGELLRELAARTSGFVGSDLAALCHEAGRVALRRAFPLDVLEQEAAVASPGDDAVEDLRTAGEEGPLSPGGLPEPVSALRIQEADWTAALTMVTPSAIGGVIPELPTTGFADVVGLDATVTQLRERLLLPLRDPALFAEAGVRVERGVLFHGPPGTGKTLLARALAHECERRFLSVRGPELLNQWFGESERAVRDLFERARHLAPSILFFDEVDALAPRRTSGSGDGGAANRVVNQLLAELDGLEDLGHVTVVGATNNHERIDPALLRPGRLGLHIEVPLPDTAGREALFALYLPQGAVEDRIPEYASRSDGMSGAAIAMVAREARLAALRRGRFQELLPVSHDDVLYGLATVRGHTWTGTAGSGERAAAAVPGDRPA